MCDFLAIQKMMLPRTVMKIRMERSPPSFYLVGDNLAAAIDWEIVFDEAYINVNFVGVASSLREHHMKLHKSRPATLPMTRTMIRNYDIPEGFHHKDITVHDQVLPKMLMVAMVRSSAFNGCIT